VNAPFAPHTISHGQARRVQLYNNKKLYYTNHVRHVSVRRWRLRVISVVARRWRRRASRIAASLDGTDGSTGDDDDWRRGGTSFTTGRRRIGGANIHFHIHRLRRTSAGRGPRCEYRWRAFSTTATAFAFPRHGCSSNTRGRDYQRRTHADAVWPYPIFFVTVALRCVSSRRPCCRDSCVIAVADARRRRRRHCSLW